MLAWVFVAGLNILGGNDSLIADANTCDPLLAQGSMLSMLRQDSECGLFRCVRFCWSIPNASWRIAGIQDRR